MFLIFTRRRFKMRFLLFFLLILLLCSVFLSSLYRFGFSQTNTIHAQESGSLSPTPSPVSSTVPAIHKINTETLRDPEAFKLDQQIKQATRNLFTALSNNDPLTSIESKAASRKTLMKEAIRKYPYYSESFPKRTGI